MKKILYYLSWVWQLPQHLLGLFLICVLKAKREMFVYNGGKNYIIWYRFERKVLPYFSFSGVSLGWYILLPIEDQNTLLHEHGHRRQSMIFGPLYLLVIGIPSAVFNNLWDRLFHKAWPTTKRYEWYYSRYPEKWADKLGGVDRWREYTVKI